MDKRHLRAALQRLVSETELPEQGDFIMLAREKREVVQTATQGDDAKFFLKRPMDTAEAYTLDELVRGGAYYVTPDEVRYQPVGGLTAQAYADARDLLERGLTQLAPDGRNCAVCGDTDHQAFHCRHNPLVIMRRYERLTTLAAAWHDELHEHINLL